VKKVITGTYIHRSQDDGFNRLYAIKIGDHAAEEVFIHYGNDTEFYTMDANNPEMTPTDVRGGEDAHFNEFEAIVTPDDWECKLNASRIAWISYEEL